MKSYQRKNIDSVCFITGISEDTVKIIYSLLQAGIRCIQYRKKIKNKKEIFFEALKIRELTIDFDACFIVNDYADISLASFADGLHIGQGDLPIEEARKIAGDKIIGVSTHNLDEALQAQKQGADYIGFGPIFHTTTKDAGNPKGLVLLREIVQSVNIPILAIGGIKTDNIQSVMNTGCYGVAVSSGILNGDIHTNVKKFLAIACKKDNQNE